VEIVPVLVVEIVPAAVVEMVPVRVVEIVPTAVVEMVPALVVEMVPVFERAVPERAIVSSKVAPATLIVLIVLLLVYSVSGVWVDSGSLRSPAGVLGSTITNNLVTLSVFSMRVPSELECPMEPADH